jgi:hypothetical protein
LGRLDRWRPLQGTDRPWPLHPILLAAYFVLFLFSVNLEETVLADVLPVLVVAVLATVALLVVAGLVVGDLRRAGLILTAVVVAFFAYGHVAELLAPLRIRVGVQQVAWAGVVGLSVVIAWRAGSWLRPLTRGLNIVAGALVLVTLVAIVPAQLGQPEGQSVGATASAEPTAPSADRPDIYYLVFDRYPSARAVELAYGIDNELYDELRARGFYVADESRANYQRTTLSLAWTLSLQYQDGRGRADEIGSLDRSDRYSQIQNSLAARFIKGQGYHYVHIGSDFSPTRTSVVADENLHYDNYSDFATAFIESTALPGIGRRLGLLGERWERRYAWTRWELDRLENLPPYPGPTFVFAHFMLPHTPYIFRADGSYVSEQQNERRSPQERYSEQLAYTNERLLGIIDRLLAAPRDQRPVIIVQADEGPYPAHLEEETRHDWTTATPEERLIKFGILNAWHIPDGRDIGLYPQVSPVNTFRLLFNGYFGTSLPILPDESFSLGHREPLEFPAP